MTVELERCNDKDPLSEYRLFYKYRYHCGRSCQWHWHQPNN